MSERHHLKVVTTGPLGHQATVEMDGEEIGKGLRKVALAVEAGEVNTATLELSLPTIEADGEFHVHLSEENQVLLKRLGWSPPEEDS
jgi:hypothetical protein